MAGHDGRVGAGPARAGRPGPVRSVLVGGGTLILGAGAGAPKGVLLDLSGEEGDMRISLLDRSGATLMSFGPFPDEDVIATWRSLAAASGLAPTMRAWSGELMPVAPQLGRVRIGTRHERRRRPAQGRRRPRFLLRRKCGTLLPGTRIHREREIATGLGV